jgi:hypothetical protein
MRVLLMTNAFWKKMRGRKARQAEPRMKPAMAHRIAGKLGGGAAMAARRRSGRPSAFTSGGYRCGSPRRSILTPTDPTLI